MIVITTTYLQMVNVIFLLINSLNSKTLIGWTEYAAPVQKVDPIPRCQVAYIHPMVAGASVMWTLVEKTIGIVCQYIHKLYKHRYIFP